MLKKLLQTFIIICCIGLSAQQDLSVSQPIGFPYIQNFPPTEYGNAHRQNWSIIQDKRGIIYVGNTAGLLTYDGVKWRNFVTKDQSLIRSLAMDDEGRIYYGAKNDFGYLDADDFGQLQFISLRHTLPDNIVDLKDIWEIQYLKGKVYFQTSNYIFTFNKKAIFNNQVDKTEIGIWESAEEMDGLSIVGDNLYFWSLGKGLMRFTDDDPKLVLGSELLSNINAVRVLSLFGKSGLLICSSSHGLFEYDGNTFNKFKGAVKLDNALAGNRVFDARYLSNGHLVLATNKTGLLIIDEKGKLLKRIDKSTGLLTNVIQATYPDTQGGLWLATTYGVSRLETTSPLEIFKEESGIESNVYTFERHQGELYVGTRSGVVKTTDSENHVFKKIEGPTDAAFSLLSREDGLLAAFPYSGIYELQNGAFKKIFNKNTPVKLVQSRYDPNLVMVGSGGSAYGFSLLYKTAQGWKRFLLNPIIKDEVREIAEEKPGVIWLGTRRNGYMRVEIPALQGNTLESQKIDTLIINYERFPKEIKTSRFLSRLYQIDNHLVFATTKGIKQIDFITKNLLPDPSLHAKLADTTIKANILRQAPNGDIWVYTNATDNTLVKLIPDNSESYLWKEIPELNRTIGTVFTNIYLDTEDPTTLWLGTPKSVIKYDSKVKRNYNVGYSSLVREVLVKRDSLIYGGDWLNTTNDFPKKTLQYSNNAMRFLYAAPSFDASEKTTYQTYLEGFDDTWSSWTLETHKDYTNLPGGNYTFKVKAKNIYEIESQVGEFAFSIRSPWYLRWWSFVFYGFLGLVVFYGFIRLRTQQLLASNRELERIVLKRTKEIEAQAEKLKELGEVKSRFFTNISHEFRTPLTIIGGMADKITENPEKWLSKGTAMIKRNSGDLLNLVTQILDLRKLESGKLKLELVQKDIVSYLKYIVASFGALAENKDIQLKMEFKQPKVLMDYDPEKIQRIISNLLSNALKFTLEGGAIFVETSIVTIDSKNKFVIQIKDTGIGIPANKIAQIFNRFYQVDDSTTRKGEGAGIGLALTQELIKIMQGNITVTSQPNKGTIFNIVLPITNHAVLVTKSEKLTKLDNSDLSLGFLNLETPENIPFSNFDSELPFLLIVEDNADVVEYLIACLEDQFQLLFARDGNEGIEKAIEHIPDIILSDVMMPKKDGFELCQTLKTDERTSHIPIVLLTAKSDQDSRLSGLERGADAYLTKPFNKEELFFQLKNLLDIRRTLQKRYSAIITPELSENIALKQEDAFIGKVREAVELHIDDEKFGIAELCTHIGISRAQLHRKMKALTGRSTSHYIRFIRLEKAKELLKSSTLNISEIAYSVGFSNPNYFSMVFSEEFGQSPSDFRK